MSSISVKEFSRLCLQAERAIQDNDDDQLHSVNRALGEIGYKIIVRDGKAYLWQMNIPLEDEKGT